MTPAFLAANTVSSLLAKSDFELEGYGRLTHPLVYDRDSDTLRPVAWEQAFARIGEILRGLQPDEVEFYTSGRASNEAAWLFQLFAREYGTNNFPDCSNMCHESTSVGLPQSIGIGKGTVSLDDFDQTELVISIGHNPGTNHPRMMGTLHELSRRGVPIIVFNPLRERALEEEQGNVLDHAFIAQHTQGFTAFADDLHATRWQDIEQESGLTRESLTQVAAAYAKSRATIVTYGMGITQHNKGTSNVRLIADLLLMRGNIGKPGAGICPLRGHSNVQGNRTVGISEKPSAAFLDSLQRVMGITPPRHHGHDAVKALEAMIAGDAKALICLGGNFAVAMPDHERAFPAMRGLELSVHVGTKLNRSHLLTAKETFILPCLGRTELDLQASGRQSITVEDSMSMVHASSGKLKPASPMLRSEPAIVAGLAKATLPASKVDWQYLVEDYDRIRDLIEQTIPGFEDYNQRIRHPGGFRMPLPPTERIWPTATGKAMFSVFKGVHENVVVEGEDVMRLVTLRSHDQYNTTIYAMDDRYRGVFGRRDVLFMNEQDMAAQGLEHGDRVDIHTALPDSELTLEDITVVAYGIAPGTVGAYYPEANVLVPLNYLDEESGTPSYKSVPVRLTLRSKEIRPLAGGR
ncbi:formate dehydrogenase oxidoreductase protein [Klebsiella pneumoniae]|uniref:Formate dehydrogenase oxidoreductase protein n=1 Tax=Klebsiella pneumoniae TaxID=573 RepID=A0A377X972_KLEPN|nr:formate dehydrogenase oxidoreductase protein [Klebsiella pneumoniae]